MGWVHDHEAAWISAIAGLTGQGWQDVVLLTVACPVQLEGRVPSGEAFYFRARWNDVVLAIGGSDPADAAPWERRVEYGHGDAAASYLESADGISLLLHLHQQWLSKAP